MLVAGDLIWVRDGRTLRLGKRLKTGGEGSVFELEGESKYVAKIYEKRPSPSRQHKIDAMINLAQPNLREMAAWPLMIARIPDKGATIGFLMQSLVGYGLIHDLYTPGSRRTHFPQYDFGELLKVAHNLSVAFHRVHQSGCIVGDVNEGNVMVGNSADVRLIDCDSFQVPVHGGSPFLCEVVTPHFTPPELQGHSDFDNIVRTENHDAFGLAILIFHLIFVGRHPFAGRPTTARDFDIPEAIKEQRFAFGPGAKSRGLAPPLNVPDLELVGPLMAKMFEVAFLPTPRDRPRPEEWAKALRTLHQNLKVCSDERGHQYPNHLSACPWCTFEQATSLILFPLSDQRSPGNNNAFNIEQFERELNSVTLSHLTSPNIEPLPSLRSRPRFKIVQGMILSSAAILASAAIYSGFASHLSPLGAITVFVLFGALAYNALAIYLAIRFRALTKVQKRIDGIISALKKDVADTEFDEQKAALEFLVTEYKNLPNLLQAKIANRNKQAREIQFQNHMNSVCLRDHKIPQFGEARKSSLAAVNIVTAWDIYQAKHIPNVRGINSGLWEVLKFWANQFAMTFVFDPRRAMPPEALLGIKREVQQSRRNLELELNNLLTSTRMIVTSINAKHGQSAEIIRGLLISRSAEAKSAAWWLH